MGQMLSLDGKKAVVTGGSQGMGRGFAVMLARQGADVAQRAGAERLRDEAVGAFGRVDILVNNVGGFPSKPVPLVDLSEDDWDRSIELNLRSAFLCCRAFAPAMMAQRAGRIVNISASLSSSVGVPTCAHYGASKAGLLTLTKALAREVAGAGVTVNAVAPGDVETPMNRIGAGKGWWDSDEELAGIPLGRSGTVDDVAAAVTFFAS